MSESRTSPGIKRCSSCKKHKPITIYDTKITPSGKSTHYKTCIPCRERQKKYRDKYIEDRNKESFLTTARDTLLIVRKVLAMQDAGMSKMEVLAHFTSPFDGSLDTVLPEQPSVIPEHPVECEVDSDEDQLPSDFEDLSFELEQPPQ